MSHPHDLIRSSSREPLLLSLLHKVIHEYKALLEHSRRVKSPSCKMIAKKFDRERQQYDFTFETAEKLRFTRTAEEIAHDKTLLHQLDVQDVYDVGYTQGVESILKEKAAMLLAKKK